MPTYRPQTWLRALGLAATAMIVARTLADQFYAGPATLAEVMHLPNGFDPVQAFRWLLAAEALAAAGFVAVFIYTTRSVAPRKPTALPLVALVVQFLLALGFGTELLIIATVAVPFVLEGRAAWIWLAAEVSGLVLLIAPMAMPGNVELSPGLTHVPFAGALTLTLAEGTVWMVFAFVCGWLIVQAERNRRDLAQRNAQLEATQSLLAQSSALNERLRISRELHDSVGHHLVGLSVNLELASHLAEGKALTPVHRAQLIAKLLLADVRETISRMREARHLNLTAAMERMAEGVTDLAIHIDLAPSLGDCDPAVAHLLFRCAQEAITNARKHAAARNLWLSITHNAAGYEFHAKDDGRGAAAVHWGNGLRGMRERAGEIGATMQATTARGRGFELRVTIPASAQTEESAA